MKLKYLGHSCFLVISKTGVRLLTDPYEPGSFNGAVSYKAFQEPVDIVTVSHEHADHNDVKGLTGDPTVVREAGTHSIKGIDLKGIETFHDTSHGAERGKNTVFTLHVDGVKLCHCGDLGHPLSPYDASLIGDIDVLMIPVGGFFTINAVEAWQIVERLQPKVVVPMHFKTDRVTFPIASVEEFLGSRVNIKRIAGSEIDIDKESLPKETEVVVLNPSQ